MIFLQYSICKKGSFWSEAKLALILRESFILVRGTEGSNAKVLEVLLCMDLGTKIYRRRKV
jgi:hypothetical protein